MPTQLRLLVCIQAVDIDDPLMGFFHTWLEEAAKQFSYITVLALRVGRYDLPKNVEIVPFRPAGSRSRFTVIMTLWREAWQRRHAYDAVFVRGDPHYVLLAGWLWRLLGKRVVFWYAHYRVSRAAVLASAVAHVTVASVKASYDHPWVKPVFIGQNINHHLFPLRDVLASEGNRCLMFGRVTPSKRLEQGIEAFIKSHPPSTATLMIAGPQADQTYLQSLHQLIGERKEVQWGDPKGVPYDHLSAYLGRFDILINAYPASLDKTIVESAMRGLLTIAATDGMREWLAEEDLWLMAKTPEERVAALQRIYHLSREERMLIATRLHERAVRFHSLEAQIQKLIPLLTPS